MMTDGKMFVIPDATRKDGSPRLGSISRRALEKLDRDTSYDLNEIFEAQGARIIHLARVKALHRPGDDVVRLDMFDV